MGVNTITNMIAELGRLQITNDKVAWEVKQLMDKLCILEESYEVFESGSGLSVEEQKRYKEEIFPDMLIQCRKMANYFSLCPEIRYNEQNDELLITCFAGYNRIVERLLTKMQKAQSVKRQSVFSKIGVWMREFCRNVYEANEILDAKLTRLAYRLYIKLPRLPWRRRTWVIYHRDSIDYVGCGYSLQPIQTLTL